MDSARELIVQAVRVNEVDHLRIAVNADRRVVPPKHFVDICLIPELTDEHRVVDDVPEARDRAASVPLEFLQCR